MDNAKQTGYNFNSVDLLIYIWKKRKILMGVGLIAGIASIIISLMMSLTALSTDAMLPALPQIGSDLLTQTSLAARLKLTVQKGQDERVPEQRNLGAAFFRINMFGHLLPPVGDMNSETILPFLNALVPVMR